MTRLDPAAACDDYRPLNHVAQFADIPRPWMSIEQRARRIADAFDVHLVLPAKLADEMLREEGNVFGALIERRQRQLEYVEPIEQIFAEQTIADCLRRC